MFVVNASAQILYNGSFEQFSSTGGASSQIALGSNEAPWVSSNGAYLNTNNFGTLGTTPYGSQYVQLTPTSYLGQFLFNFTPGFTYVLGANFADLNGSSNPQLTFTLTFDTFGTVSQSFTGLVQGGTSNLNYINFNSAVMVFTPPPGVNTNTTVSLVIKDNGNANLALDNVALYGGPSLLIPEPSTWALLLGGLSGLAFWQLRRNSRKA